MSIMTNYVRGNSVSKFITNTIWILVGIIFLYLIIYPNYLLITNPTMNGWDALLRALFLR